MTDSEGSTASEKSYETESKRALLHGAQRLLAQRPPSAITNKQIAVESGVKSGLIYHYFESKDALFLAAMEDLTSDYIRHRDATVDRSVALPRMTFEGHELWWRAAANFSADGGASYTSLGWTYPVMNHELDEILKHHPEVSELEAKSHIVREVCLNFGWMFFKDTLARGMQLSDEQMTELGHFISE